MKKILSEGFCRLSLNIAQNIFRLHHTKNMRPLKLLLCLVLLISTVYSCRKLSDPEPAEGKPVSNQMFAAVDGGGWNASSITAIRTANNSFSITGSSIDGKSITLYIDDLRTGQFQTTIDNKDFSTFVDDTTKVTYRTKVPGGEGYITVSGLDETNKTISGKFNFVAYSNTGDTVIVSEGRFIRVPYSTGGAGGGKKEISAKIDGGGWSADNVFAISSSGKLTISGFRNDNTAIGLQMPADITTGSYDIDSLGSYTTQYNKNQVEILKGLTGTLLITEHNPGTKTIKGEFTFEAELPGNPDNHSTITDGVFEAAYD
jgi:hypothetical protein